MARIATVLAAIQRLAWRDMQSLLSIPGNNLFAFAVLLAKQPESVEFFILFVVMAALTVFSEDPAKKVAARLSLWPLGFRQRLAIRMAALMMTPAFLLAAGTSIVTQHANVALSLVGGTLGLQAARSFLSAFGCKTVLGLAAYYPHRLPLRPPPSQCFRFGRC
jgi:hypothetical protein